MTWCGHWKQKEQQVSGLLGNSTSEQKSPHLSILGLPQGNLGVALTFSPISRFHYETISVLSSYASSHHLRYLPGPNNHRLSLGLL